MQRFGKLFVRNARAQEELNINASDAELDALIDADEQVGRRIFVGLLADWNLPTQIDPQAVCAFVEVEAYQPLIAEMIELLLAEIRKVAEEPGKPKT